MKKILALLLTLALVIPCVGCGSFLSKNEKLALAAVNTLADKLKDPSSLQVYDIQALETCGENSRLVFCINFGARNGYGGMNRNNWYVQVEDGKIPTYTDQDDDKLAEAVFESSAFLYAMSQTEFGASMSYDGTGPVSLDVDKIMDAYAD